MMPSAPRYRLLPAKFFGLYFCKLQFDVKTIHEHGKVAPIPTYMMEEARHHLTTCKRHIMSYVCIPFIH